jgi:hypothetical protein
MRKLGVFGVVGLFAALATSSALAVSLVDIAPVGTDTATSGRSVTAGGIAVGTSGSLGMIWDSTNGTRNILSSDNAQATVATGVTYRTAGGQQQLVVHGLSAGYSTLWFSNDNGVTWGLKARDTTVGGSPTIGTSGTCRAIASSDVVYHTWWNNTSSGPLYLDMAAGEPADITHSSKGVTAKSDMRSVSATGVAVGMRRDSGGNNQNYMLTWNGTATPTATYFMGLAGDYFGQAWAINDAGDKVFGMSPVSDGRTGNWPYMVTNPGASQTIVELPTFADTAGSTSNGLVYGSSQTGDFAVGMNYRGTEKAVLWDTAGMTITDLTEYFAAKGMLGNFSRLSRAYGVAEDGTGGLWITGQGVWSADGGVTNYTRGFVAWVPEPASMILLALGSLLVIRRRR